MSETSAAVTAEARELRDVVIRLADERDRPETLDECLALWDELVELGVRDIGVTAELGGSGGSLAELTAVAGGLAEHGVSVPVVEASAGRWASVTGGEPLAGLVGVGLAAGRPDQDVSVTLPWGRAAAAAVICAVDEARLVPVETVDEFDDLAGEPLDTFSMSADAWHGARVLAVSPAHVLDRVALLRAAALFGAARGAYVLTRGYTAQRRQFGGPLRDIPAVAGHLATMKVELVQAEASLIRAIGLADRADAGTRAHSAIQVAGVVCADVAGEIAHLAHQIHGAVGITAEYPLHRLTRRIWAWRDRPHPNGTAARELGAAALAGGEPFVWSELTGWCPVTTGD